MKAFGEMKRLTKQHIFKMHNLLIQETSGIHGIRDEALLVLPNAPFQSFDGRIS